MIACPQLEMGDDFAHTSFSERIHRSTSLDNIDLAH